jgi:hypothetical protein
MIGLAQESNPNNEQIQRKDLVADWRAYFSRAPAAFSHGASLSLK